MQVWQSLGFNVVFLVKQSEKAWAERLSKTWELETPVKVVQYMKKRKADRYCKSSIF